MINKLVEDFRRYYKTSKTPLVFFAPGRVNIIGEHIDYNGGNVLPFAIELGTYVVVNLRNDNIVNLYSHNFSSFYSVDLNNIVYDKKYDWANYPLGVIQTLRNEGYTIDKGLDLYFFGNLPYQAGLSSSASIELVTAVALNNIFNLQISNTKLALLCQKAENIFLGLKCGIMDQFVIATSKKDNAICLNTKTLHFTHIPMLLDDYCFVVTNSNKKRQLVDSEYNKRLQECNAALKILKSKFEADYLCDIPMEVLEANRNLFDNETIYKRALHVISEQQRTLQAAEALRVGNLSLVGKLLNQSHYSLRDNYEVSCRELDILQHTALDVIGVLGSRMTGAGFGGCTITLINQKSVELFVDQVAEVYTRQVGYKPDFYVVNSSDGSRKIF